MYCLKLIFFIDCICFITCDWMLWCSIVNCDSLLIILNVRFLFDLWQSSRKSTRKRTVAKRSNGVLVRSKSPVRSCKLELILRFSCIDQILPATIQPCHFYPCTTVCANINMFVNRNALQNLIFCLLISWIFIPFFIIIPLWIFLPKA